MDFFEHQDRARRNTWKLVFFFTVATLLIMTAVNVVAFAVWLGWRSHASAIHQPMAFALQQWLLNPNAWFTAGATIVIVLSGSLLQWASLAKGGEAVAAMAGARPVEDFRNDLKVTQFRHVVEEMAIASGMPVPRLYIMDHEAGINAFVAGYQAHQAVMVATRGMLEHLNREQIQGVVGHEFSHILNGDMRLNIRLMSLLAGIVLIGQFGRFIIDLGGWGGYRYRSSRDDRGSLPLVLAGLALIAIGGIGVFFGRLIRAAVSRQREFLADASSVQFTRNPEAIAGALYQIQRQQVGSLLYHRHAEDMSHFCFGESVRISAFAHMLATHPPIPERIKRVAPAFMARQRSQENKDLENIARQQSTTVEQATIAGMSTGATNLAIRQIAGQSSPTHVEYAHKLYKQIPAHVRTLLTASAGARAFCYGLIIPGTEQQPKLLKLIKDEDLDGARSLTELWKWQRRMPDQLRLPCLELCIPALRKHSGAEIGQFLQRIERICILDLKVVAMEWMLLSLLQHHLSPEQKMRDKTRYHSLKPLGAELQLLFSALVYLNTDLYKASTAYKQVMATVGFAELWLLSRSAVQFEQLQQALKQLNGVSFILKESIIQGCSDIILSDEQINVAEYDYLRTISTVLGCPMPPLILDYQQTFKPH